MQLLAVVLVVVAFVAALFQQFLARFEVGDVYPAYSSYRSDPLGTRALYDSLNSLPGLTAERHISASPELPEGAGRTMLVLNLARETQATRADIEAMEHFMVTGGRIVLTLDTLREIARRRRGLRYAVPVDEGDGEDGDGDGDGDAEADEDEPETAPEDLNALSGLEPVNWRRRWGIRLEFLQAERGALKNEGVFIVSRSTDDPRLPPSMPWHTPVAFALNDGDPWEAVYATRGYPVVMRRPFGSGDLVVAGDSFHWSNEALRDDLHAEYLTALLGQVRTVLFDETHLGVMQQEGIMTLARKYRLHGVFAALAVLALVYLWDRLSRLLPPADDDPLLLRTGLQTGWDAGSGLKALVRRHIPRAKLLATCVERWGRSVRMPHSEKQRAIAALTARTRREMTRPRKDRDPAACYDDLCRIVKNREWKR